jgi:large subunit ribosomal protein L25
MLTLEVKERGKGKADDLRRRGFVPAVVYGHKEESASIAVDARQLERVWKEAGHTSVVTLKGAGPEKDTLLKEVQVHPVSGRIVHVDFYALEKGKKIQISVPLAFVGEAPAEKAGHILVKALHEIEIEVAPQDLPHALDVHLENLQNVGDHISASQIPLPQSAVLITEGDETVVSVTAFVEEKEREPAAAPAESGQAAAAAEPQAEQEAAE